MDTGLATTAVQPVLDRNEDLFTMLNRSCFLKRHTHYSTGHGVLLLAVLITTSGPLLAQTQSGQPSCPVPATAATASSANSAAPSHGKSEDNSYVIGNEDVLGINVWKEPDLTRSYPVRSDGKISLPLMGEVQATGCTPLQLEQIITAGLQNYLTKPEVTVMVDQINSKKFNIVGQVVRPGSYSITIAPTVMDAIATAGGLRDFAKKTAIYVLRRAPSGGEQRFVFNYKDFLKGKNLDQNVKLEPHDTVVVP